MVAPVTLPPLTARALEGNRDSVLHTIANIRRVPGGVVTASALAKRAGIYHQDIARYLDPLEIAGYINVETYPGGRIKRCDLTEFGWAVVGNKPLEVA